MKKFQVRVTTMKRGRQTTSIVHVGPKYSRIVTDFRPDHEELELILKDVILRLKNLKQKELGVVLEIIQDALWEDT